VAIVKLKHSNPTNNHRPQLHKTPSFPQDSDRSDMLHLPILHIHLQFLQLDRIQLTELIVLLLVCMLRVLMTMWQKRQHEPFQRSITIVRAGVDTGEVFASSQTFLAKA